MQIRYGSVDDSRLPWKEPKPPGELLGQRDPNFTRLINIRLGVKKFMVYHPLRSIATVHRIDEYESEVTAGHEDIASVLSGVADGIRTGAVWLGDDTDAVTVDTPDELTLEIELETEADGTSLELELEWPVSSDTSPVSSVEVTSGDTDEESTLVGATDGSRSLARFEVYQARDEEWRWRLRHRNGNIIATSGEGYTRKHNAMKGLRSVMANSTDATITGEFTNYSRS